MGTKMGCDCFKLTVKERDRKLIISFLLDRKIKFQVLGTGITFVIFAYFFVLLFLIIIHVIPEFLSVMTVL